MFGKAWYSFDFARGPIELLWLHAYGRAARNVPAYILSVKQVTQTEEKAS